MNREEFLSILEDNLYKLPQEEKDAAMQYYTEYLDEAGVENEREAIAGLGNPTQIAKQLMADFVVKEAEVKPMRPKQSFQAFWIVIVALFAGPIALPLAIAIAALGFAAVITVLALIFAGCVIVISMLGSALLCGIVGMISIFIHPATGAVFVGVGCVLLGIGILAAVLMYAVIGKGIPMIVRG
ncbi:MAG: DUF1700 domain-containing protein, partial [Niameybacter sp.]